MSATVLFRTADGLECLERVSWIDRDCPPHRICRAVRTRFVASKLTEIEELPPTPELNKREYSYIGRLPGVFLYEERIRG